MSQLFGRREEEAGGRPPTVEKGAGGRMTATLFLPAT